MSDMTVKLTSLLDSLPQSENKFETLDGINVLLSALSPADLKAVVPNLSFASLFECVGVCCSKEHLEACCNVLGKLLDAVNSQAILSNFHSELLVGLALESELVVNLCLNQVNRAVETGQQMTSYVELIQKVVSLIGSKSLTTSKQATHVITCVGKTQEGLELLLLSREVVGSFEAVLEESDEKRFRVFECIVGIAAGSAEGLHLACSCGLFQRFMSELETDDVLIQLNCLELLSSLVIAEHALCYLEQRGTLSLLEDMLVNTESNPFGEILIPGLLKVFGSICYMWPMKALAHYQKFCRFLFSVLDSSGVNSVTGIAVETIGFIASRSDGKKALGQKGEMKSVCSRLGVLLTDAPTEIRERVIEALTHLMHLKVSEQTDELLALTEDWFSQLSPSSDESIGRVLAIARQPFTELRIGALQLVGTLAALPWCQSKLFAQAGFLEYLLDRSTERDDRTGLEAKYNIVTMIVNSLPAAHVLPGEYLLRLKEYAKEGPFYVKHESHVAFDSAE